MTATDRQSRARERWHAVGVLAVGVLVAGALAFAGGSGGGIASPLVGHAAPALAGTIAAGVGAAEGDRIDIEALRGRVVVLDFWASWCGPCRVSVPILNRIAARHREAGFSAVGINTEPDLSAGRLAEAHRAIAAEFPTIRDPRWLFQAAYRVDSLPTIVLVGRDGVVTDVFVGVPDEDWLDGRVRELLGL